MHKIQFGVQGLVIGLLVFSNYCFSSENGGGKRKREEVQEDSDQDKVARQVVDLITKKLVPDVHVAPDWLSGETTSHKIVTFHDVLTHLDTYNTIDEIDFAVNKLACYGALTFVKNNKGLTARRAAQQQILHFETNHYNHACDIWARQISEKPTRDAFARAFDYARAEKSGKKVEISGADKELVEKQLPAARTFLQQATKDCEEHPKMFRLRAFLRAMSVATAGIELANKVFDPLPVRQQAPSLVQSQPSSSNFSSSSSIS